MIEHLKKYTFKKGMTPWNKGLHVVVRPKGTYRHSEQTKRKLSMSHRGLVPVNKGKKGLQPWTEEQREWRRLKFKGLGNPFYGKKHTKKSIDRMKKSHSGHISWNMDLTADKDKRILNGEHHWNWLGGKSFEPYSPEFNRLLKLQVKQRDGFICQECGLREDGQPFIPHHIDYNKKNNSLDNLILLCRSCNSKVNFKRDDWMKYFQDKVERMFGGV